MDAPSKTDLAQQAYELAMTYELEYGCCPQCVLAAVQETAGGVAPEVTQDDTAPDQDVGLYRAHGACSRRGRG